MNYYNPETAPATNGTCLRHNEPLVLYGRMDISQPLEYVCPFCMNDLDKECLHANDGKCKGAIQVFFTDYGTPTAQCEQHQLNYYQRQDRINAQYR